MKKTFTTTFFRRALFLVLLFGGVTNLWGADFSYSFLYSQTDEHATHISNDGNYTVISGDDFDGPKDGDFYWSQNKNNVKSNVVSDYTSVQGEPYFRAKETHAFQAGTYTIVIKFLANYSGKSMSTPEFYIGSYKATKDAETISFTDDNKGTEVPVTYTVDVKIARDYYFQGQFGSNPDIGFKTAEFTFQGGPTPTCTNTFTLPCGDESLVINSLTEGKSPVVNGTLNGSTNAPSTSANYICIPDDNQDKKVFYQGFEISESTSGTITIKHASYVNYAPAKVTLYRTGGSGDKVTYNNEDYFKCIEYDPNLNSKSNEWVIKTSDNQTFNAGKYLIALQSTNWKGVWVEYVTITADDDVFCFETYALTLSNDGHGSAESNQTDDSAIPEGTKVTITATPNTGYAFDKWTGSSTETDNPFTFTMNAAKNYTATFKKSTKVCTNTLTWEAEDGKELNLKISGKVEPLTAYETETDAGATPSTASPNYIEIGEKSSDRERLCYAFEISEATTCSLTVRSKTSQTWDLSAKFELWATNMSGDDHFEYNGDTYNKALKDQSFKVYQSWKEDTKSLGTLVAGKYILAIGKDYQPTDYDYFTITASDDVFCTEAPATGYSITYHCNGSTTCPEDEEDQTNLPDPLPTLSKAGFNFGGWFSDEQFEHPVTAGTELEDNIDLYAKWTEDLSTVWYMKGNFKDDWETQYDFVKATGHSTEKEASVTVQNLAANADYWFQIWDNNTNHGATNDNQKMYYNNTGWYLDGSKNVGVHTTAAGDYTFTVNFAGNDPSLTVHYPEFVTVTVNLMGHGGNNYELYTSPNGTISKPADPTADGFTFVGWFANDACTTPFNFEAPIAANTTIYAKWSQAYYYHGDWEKWEANEMTCSEDGTYWYWYTSKSDKNRLFKIQKSGTWYGYQYNAPEFHCTDIKDMNKTGATWDVIDDRCAVYYNGNDNYYIIVYVPNTGVNKTNNPIICASTFLPESSYSVAAGNKIYFDNSTTQWSNVYFRIGHKCWTSKIDMTKVPGTQNLYSCTTTEFTDYNAFHVADNTAWTEANDIYAVRPGSLDINNCLSFIKENITTDITLIPTTTESSTPSYYGYNKSYGMLTHKVTLNEVANGTINVAYTDVAGSAQNMTSGSADLAHTCILTITFTPAQGHHKTSFQVNGQDFTPGSQWILTEDITISATCAINQHNLTWADIEGATLTGDYTKAGLVNYGTTLVAPTTVSKTGYEFTGWTPAVAATMPDNDVTYTAQWNINHYTLTWAGIEGATLKTAGTEAGEVNFGTSLKAPVYEKTGYTFAGWNPAVAATMPAAATTYTAQWTAKTYNLTLDKNEGSADGRVTVTYDSNTITDFSAPTRDNYIIEGFYAENTCTTKVMNADGTLCTSVENYTDASGNWVKDEACTLYAKWTEKTKVDAMIVTGDVNYVEHNDGYASFTYTHLDDAFFGHRVLKIKYSNMSDNWGNSVISIDNGYQSSSSTGATGFGFWYKTDAGVTSIAFCLDYNGGSDQKKTQLPGTNGAWKYVYVKSSQASGWNHSSKKIIIWMNGQDNEAANGEWTPSTLPHNKETTYTNPSSGTLYISEIRATEITEKFINHTVTFEQPSQGSTSAQIKDGATINSGDEVPEGTQVIFTWNEKSGYDFVNFSDGTNTYTQNPCTLPVNSDLTITTNVKVEIPKYDLTVSVNDNNMGTATGTDKYAEGDKVSLTATPNEHYRFVKWTVEGEAVSTDANYTYTMPNKATTIVANFEAIPQYTITFDATTNGGTCATASKDIYAGDAIGTLPEATRDNYNMTGWFDAAIGGNQITESTIPTGNVTYYAQFAVAPLVECTKHKKLECEDAMIPYDNLTIVNSGVAGPKTATFGNNDKRGEYSGRGYMLTVSEDAGSQIYIPLSISGEEQAALTMQIRYANSQDTYSKIRIYKETQESGDIQVTNTGKNYLRISSDKFASSGWQKPFTTATYNKTLDPGNYIIGLWAMNDARFDYIDISTTNDVLCTTTPRYELKLEINDPEKGENATGAGAYTEGALAPINVTAKSGYEFVAWKKGETLVSTEASFNYTMPAENVTLTAYFDTEATKRTLTASVADGQSSWGHVNQTSQQVGEGREAQVTAIVDDNQYRFDHWSSTDVELTEQQAKANPLKFTMPTKDVAVVAHFVFDEVHNMIATGTSDNIDDNRLDGGGSITKSAVESSAFDHTVLKYDYSINNGDYCGYSLPTDAGYTVDSKATGFAFWFMTNDKVYMEIKANSNPKVFKLPNTNGEWHYTYLEDNDAKTATSFEVWMNYEKGGWSMSNPKGTMYITEIQATNVTSQEPIVPPVDLTVVVSPNESGTVKTYPATTTGLVKGTQVTLTATPADNYRFVNWTVGGAAVSTEATYNRIVNATETITANFVRVYTLNVGYDANIASVTGEGQYAAGESVTVTATAAQSYKFTKWTKDNASGKELATTSSYTFDMPATDNYTVYANSEEDIVTYHITLGTCPNGTIAATVGGEPYTGGELTANTPVVLTATPNDGYGFVQWIDGSREKTHTIYANAETQDITWTATFDQIYTVTTEFGKPGSEVKGGGTYPIGGQVTLEAFVSDKDYDLDYNFSRWEQVSGTAPITEHEHDNPLTFTMPAQDLKLKAIYAPVECVDTYIIQCEDNTYYIKYNETTTDDILPYEIPHSGSCGVYDEYYTKYHGTGYYDYKTSTNNAMYYMTKLPAAATYSFSMWIASNSDLTQTLSIYYKDETGASNDLIYHGVHYAKYSQSVSDGNHGPDTWPFKESKALTGYTISQPQDIIICLHASGGESAAFDQIKITANQNVFCHELSTETFTINSGETKEIPVCGVNNLIIYDGGQANNEENVEVKTSVKHIRQVKQLDVWEDFALPFTATSIQVEDPKNHNMYDIYSAIRQYDGDKWTVRAGYFVLEELKHEEMATVIGTEFRQRWEMTINEKPQANTPYILEFTSTQSNGYFKDTYITYGMTGSTEVLGFEDATVDHGSWPTDGTKPTYHYVANNSVVPVYPYDAYVLNDDHTEFVLTDHPEILPFHCYIQASAETKAKAPRLRLVGGGSTPTLIPVVEALNVDAEGVFKFIMDDKVYILRNGVLYNAVGQHVK